MHQAQRFTIVSGSVTARRAVTRMADRVIRRSDSARARLTRAISGPSTSPDSGTAQLYSFSGRSRGQTSPMNDPTSRLVVVGASAGGIEPLKRMLGELPADLPAAVAVVLHIPATGSRLPDILNRSSGIPAAHAVDGEPVVDRRIVVAPPDRHLLVRRGRFVVVRGPRENGMRPAIDPLFRSAAAAYAPRVVAVVLSGSGADGSAGAAAVSSAAGCVIVQDPAEADFPGMPETAIARDHPDRVVPVERIAAEVVAAVRDLPEEAALSENDRDEMNLETSFAELDRETIEISEPPGRPSVFGCPACGGVLWEVDDAVHRFRCRVGHAYTDEGVLAEEVEQIDTALWSAFRALHERAELASRTARRSRGQGGTRVADRLESQAREALDQAELIRTILLERDVSGG